MVNLHPIIRDRLRSWATSSKWFERQAAESIRQGWFEVILDRSGKDIYMLRMWLCQPRKSEDGRWDSAESVLLHLFFRPDEDAAMHDHPWDFVTTILQGQYREIRPASDWYPPCGGPSLEEWSAWWGVGQTVEHKAADLHAVAELSDVVVWTLVRTSRRVRDWGFHPHAQDWQPWRQYLGLEAPGAKALRVEKVFEVIPTRDPVNGALQAQP